MSSAIDIDWDTFRTQCYDPNPSYWHTGLANRVKYMFNLRSFSIVSTYIDDDLRRVATIVQFHLTDSNNYDSKNGIIYFIDVFKVEGRDYFDEVIVDSELKIYKATRKNINCYKNYLEWKNLNQAEAPSRYYLYFKVPVEVSFFGLPNSIIVKIEVEDNVYALKGEEVKTFYVKEEDTISVEEYIYENDGVRYRCANNSIVTRPEVLTLNMKNKLR